MNKRNTLEVLKPCFEKIIPSHDARTAINPLSFVVCLVFCYLGDAKIFSLEAIRRFMKSQLNTDISRSAFWERLGRDRLHNDLGQVVAELMITLTSSVLRGDRLLKSLGGMSIWLVEASSMTLWKRAKNHFPGTRTAAGIKWHASFDLLTGRLTWLQVTPTKTQERNCFPALELLKGK